MNFNVMKKVRKLSRKGKLLIDDQNLDEKKEMISALTIKTNKSPQEKTMTRNDMIQNVKVLFDPYNNKVVYKVTDFSLLVEAWFAF